MYYEFECPECGYRFTLKKPMSRAAEQQDCLKCLSVTRRIFSLPNINMNEWVATGQRRTNEPPDELKPGIERIIHEREQGCLVSYPNKPAKRLPAFE